MPLTGKILTILLLTFFLIYPGLSQPRENVLIILDCSMSMDEEIAGQIKLDIAKNVIRRVLSEIPPDVKVGLRVYGHKRDRVRGLVGLDKCEVSELLVPIGQGNAGRIIQEVSRLKPVGMTPICYSLEQAQNFDFTNLPGKKRIILVSDGMETCYGNPCSLAVELVRKNRDISIDVIGFDVSSDRSVLNNLRCVALVTRGNFYVADSPEEFLQGMKESFSVSTDVQGAILNK